MKQSILKLEQDATFVDYAEICFAFLHISKLQQKEVTILLNDTHFLKGPEPGGVTGKTYTDTEIPSKKEFLKLYQRHRAGIMCMGCLDDEDTIRMGLVLFPEEFVKSGSLESPTLIITADESIPDGVRNAILEELQKGYEKLV